MAEAGIALLCCAARQAEKIGCRDREYGLHARDGRQDRQAGQDKEKREGEGKRKGVETMEGRKAELECPKFLRISGNEAQRGGHSHGKQQ